MPLMTCMCRNGKWVYAATLFLLLAYSSLLDGSLALVHCVEVYGVPHRRLRTAEDEVVCTQTWQYPVFAAVAFLFLVPFFVAALLWFWKRRWEQLQLQLQLLETPAAFDNVQRAVYATFCVTFRVSQRTCPAALTRC